MFYYKYYAFIILLFAQNAIANTFDNFNKTNSNEKRQNVYLAADTSTKNQVPSSTKQSTDFNKYKVIVKPTLQVMELSGDIVKWTNSLSINSPQIIKFRVLNNNPNATSFIWQASTEPYPQYDNKPHFSGVIKRGLIESLNPPGKITIFKIGFSSFIADASKSVAEYYVRIVFRDADRKYIGLPSLPVKINYQIQSMFSPVTLDSLQMLEVSPSAGVIYGPIDKPEGQVLNEQNSIEIIYGYDLKSETDAEIRHWLLLDQDGRVAQNNHWYSVPISKGQGQEGVRATIKCKSIRERITVIKGVRYLMTNKDNILYDGTEMFPASIEFRCGK